MSQGCWNGGFIGIANMKPSVVAQAHPPKNLGSVLPRRAAPFLAKPVRLKFPAGHNRGASSWIIFFWLNGLILLTSCDSIKLPSRGITFFGIRFYSCSSRRSQKWAAFNKIQPTRNKREKIGYTNPSAILYIGHTLDSCILVNIGYRSSCVLKYHRNYYSWL